MKPVDFIEALVPAAQKSMRMSGIPASIILAQAALESGWGVSQLYAMGKNIFGVKAGPYWTGNTLSMPTKEFVNGKPVTVDALWRAYATVEEAIADHAAFLLGNKRYRPCFDHKDAAGFAKALQAAGYSTNPRYADLLLQIIQAHDLTAYDKATA